MSETWRAIPGYEDIYEVSDQARVRSLDRFAENKLGVTQKLRGRVLSRDTNLDGSTSVTLSRDGKPTRRRVEELMRAAFGGGGSANVEPAEAPATELIPLGVDDDPRIRSEWIDGERRWVLDDIAKVLGYREAYDVARLVDDEDKGPHTVRTLGGPQRLLMVNKSGVFAILINAAPRDEERRARLKAYRRWVTSEVLPSVHETGSYTHPSARPAPPKLSSLEMLRTVIDSAIELEQKQAALNQRVDGVDERVTATELETWDNTVRLDAIEGRHGWYAAPGWAGLRGFRQTDGASLAALGHRAARIGKAAGLQPGKVPHPRFTSQNTWPVWVWDQAAKELWSWTPPAPSRWPRCCIAQPPADEPPSSG